MMTKNLLSILSVLALIVVASSITSAAVTFFPNELSGTVERGKTFSVTFKIQNDNTTTALTSITSNFEALTTGSNSIATSAQALSGLASSISNNTNSSTITYTVTVPSSQTTGTYKGNITINGTYGSQAVTHTLPVQLTVNTASNNNLCAKQVGTLKIDSFNVDNFGEGDDEEWEGFDELELEVDIENTGNDDVKDVLVEIFIEDDQGNDVTNDFEIKDEELDFGTVRDDDTETDKFIIEELPADLDEGTYRIYLKAYSERNEDEHCVSESRDFNQDLYHEIDFVREDDESVVVRDKDLGGSVQAVCGEEGVQLRVPIYNLGVDKEKRVLVNLFNRDLGIDEYKVVSNLGSGKRKEVSFLFNVPETASKGTYNMDIYTHFDWDDDEDELEESSYDQNSRDDLDKDFKKKLEVISCSPPIPSITADLASGAKKGSEMVVKVSVTNNGREEARYAINALGFDTWADLKDISPRSLNLEEGESGDVTVTLVPKEVGFQSFRLVATSNGQDYNQPVTVNVAGETDKDDEDKGSSLTGMFENKFLTYILIGIGILVILILLALIGRLSTRRRE